MPIAIIQTFAALSAQFDPKRNREKGVEMDREGENVYVCALVYASERARRKESGEDRATGAKRKRLREREEKGRKRGHPVKALSHTRK